MKFLVPGLCLAAVFALLVGCAPPSMPEAPEGAAFFAANCASCHGADARGGARPDLAVAPRDLTLLARENGGTFPTARALSYILGRTGWRSFDACDACLWCSHGG